MAEIWDLFYRDGTPAGRTMIRGEKAPKGLYHIVCEVLVRHTDGEYLLMHRCASKPNYPDFWEGTAGGSALKGEDALACIRRELREETGLEGSDFTLVARNINQREDAIFYTFTCVTDCDKSAVQMQEGETDAFKWVSEEEFAACGLQVNNLTYNLHENGIVGIMTGYEEKFHALGTPINRCEIVCKPFVLPAEEKKPTEEEV